MPYCFQSSWRGVELGNFCLIGDTKVIPMCTFWGMYLYSFPLVRRHVLFLFIAHLFLYIAI